MKKDWVEYFSCLEHHSTLMKQICCFKPNNGTWWLVRFYMTIFIRKIVSRDVSNPKNMDVIKHGVRESKFVVTILQTATIEQTVNTVIKM